MVICLGRRRRSKFDESAGNNDRTYIQYVEALTELATTMFEWKNLPDSIDPRFLEITLFSRGSCVFFKDEVMGYLGLPVLIKGRLNVYRIPIDRQAFSVNGYRKNLTEKDSVIIWNNYIHTNSELLVRNYAQRLYNLDRVIDVNANAQKTPILIKASEQQKLTLQNMYMQWDGNEPAIFADSQLDTNNFSVLKTDAPYIADKIYMLKTQYWNECLTRLGISNVNIQKKERLISDEVSRAMGGVIASRYSRLEMRRQACDEINRMFGLNVEVDYRDDFRQTDDEFMIEGETGEEKATPMVTDLRTRSSYE